MLRACFIALSLVLLSIQSNAPDVANRILITNVNVFDGVNQTLVKNANVMVIVCPVNTNGTALGLV
jgi:hypothetical protein